jgi:hypothetical protein
MGSFSHPGWGTLRHPWIVWGLAGALLGGGCTGGSAPPPASSSTSSLPPPVGSSLPATSTTAARSTTTTTSTTATTVPSTSSSTVPATTTSTIGAWWRPVTAETPLRVWVLGDSLAETAGPALARAAAEAGWLVATTDAVKGSGLARPDFFDWPLAVAEGLVKRRAEVVVCLIGANDGQALRLSDRSIPFGTPEWDTEYASRVGTLMDLLLSGATRVYWVGVPIMADPGYDGRVQHINVVQRAQADARPGVVFIDGYALFQDEGGGYATHLPDDLGNPVEVRQPDGVHLTGGGADRLARSVLALMAVEWPPPGG